MHIVHISTVHSPDDTRIFEKECCGLVDKGFKVSLIIKCDENHVRKGVNVKSLPDFSGRFSRMTYGVIIAAKKALAEKGDIYHLHDPELLPLGLLLKVLGKVVVYDMHENLPEQIMNKLWIPLLVRKPLSFFIKSLEKFSLNKIAVVMAEHSYSASYNWVTNKQVVLNLPKVDKLLKISEHLQKKQYVVGYIGGVSRVRGIITVLEAIHKLRLSGLPIQFECIGGVSQDVLADPIYQEGVQNGWIHSPGRLPPEKGWPIIARCQIGVAVLKPIGNYVSSYPTKMFEYMAMGLPVIVSNFKLYQEIIDKHKCGLCVDPDSIDEVADAIRFFVQNKKETIEMGERGKKAVFEHYKWDTELKNLISFYKVLMQDSF